MFLNNHTCYYVEIAEGKRGSRETSYRDLLEVQMKDEGRLG